MNKFSTSGKGRKELEMEELIKKKLEASNVDIVDTSSGCNNTYFF